MTSPDRPAGNAFATVDFDKPGRQAGFVMFPHSPHDDAWGVTRLPIGIIANGTGPTVILEGGNHGDEYEGSITISEMMRDLDPAKLEAMTTEISLEQAIEHAQALMQGKVRGRIVVKI